MLSLAEVLYRFFKTLWFFPLKLPPQACRSTGITSRLACGSWVTLGGGLLVAPNRPSKHERHWRHVETGEKNNEKSMAKFEIKEKYTRITTGNELMDGVPKSKQDFHDDKGQRCVKMGQDLHGCKTSDRQDAFALKVTSKGL